MTDTMTGIPDRIVSAISRSLCIPLCIVSFLILSSAVQAEIEGPRKIWSIEPYFTWVSEISYLPGDLSVTINDNPPGPGEVTINNYTGSVHARMPLEYGASNLVIVKAGDSVLFIADIFYAPVYEAGLVTEEYEYNFFHIDANEKPCLQCHRLSVRDSDKLPATPADSICFPCHNSKFSGLTFQHNEAGVNWKCLRCHQSEAMETDFSPDRPVKFVIEEGMKIAPLCYECHKKNKKEYSAYKYIHGPVATAGCGMCHDPHGSNFRNFLYKDPSTLCIECHNMKDKMEQPNTHEPVVKEGCIKCHNPHGNNFTFFLDAKINGLCYKCHKKIQGKGNNHPINGHPVSAPEDPANAGRQFSCVSCQLSYKRLKVKNSPKLLIRFD
jgi:predicted CXXCH cytochrome family protein